jgi:hypothetical protein
MTETVNVGKKDETLANLSEVLSAEGLTYSVNDEGHIYVTAGLEYPMWIDFHEELSAIRIFTYGKIRASTFDETAALELVNRMNMNFVPNQVYYLEDSVYCCYTILAYDRISRQLFMNTLKHCAGAFIVAAQECDIENLFGHRVN